MGTLVKQKDIEDLEKDPTKEYAEQTKGPLKQLVETPLTLRKKDSIKPLNPEAPQMYELVKVHKKERTVVAYTTAPAYKLVKYLTNCFKQ